MKTFTKMSSSSVSDGTVVHLSSNASSLYSNIDTEKFPSSVFKMMVLVHKKKRIKLKQDRVKKQKTIRKEIKFNPKTHRTSTLIMFSPLGCWTR